MAARIEADYATAGLEPRRRAMLRYVDRLTRTPAQITESDAASLRDAGFADSDILAIVEVASYYAYSNRIANGLGVEMEE
ncbi:MAG: peroxidase [Armatimonadetes bacterium]|nr:peroxidase [Armatimonadota bacterium]